MGEPFTTTYPLEAVPGHRWLVTVFDQQLEELEGPTTMVVEAYYEDRPPIGPLHMIPPSLVVCTAVTIGDKRYERPPGWQGGVQWGWCLMGQLEQAVDDEQA